MEHEPAVTPQSAQTWDPDVYAKNARFVADLGQPVVDLLAPRPGERILDLGCGDGALTKRLAELGCDVVGVDSSAAQVAAARARGLDARRVDGYALAFDGEFDAVFSNAALHWMKDAERVLAGVHRALRPGGRFVAECGGSGCVETIDTALIDGLQRRGLDGLAASPWYFPTTEDYGQKLTTAGFDVEVHRAHSEADPVARRHRRVARNVLRELHPRPARGGAGPVPRGGARSGHAAPLRFRRTIDRGLRSSSLRGSEEVFDHVNGSVGRLTGFVDSCRWGPRAPVAARHGDEAIQERVLRMPGLEARRGPR